MDPNRGPDFNHIACTLYSVRTTAYIYCMLQDETEQQEHSIRSMCAVCCAALRDGSDS
jgi:hypothetical protein